LILTVGNFAFLFLPNATAENEKMSAKAAIRVGETFSYISHLKFPQLRQFNFCREVARPTIRIKKPGMRFSGCAYRCTNFRVLFGALNARFGAAVLNEIRARAEITLALAGPALALRATTDKFLPPTCGEGSKSLSGRRPIS
jgi:hypothetical protein